MTFLCADGKRRRDENATDEDWERYECGVRQYERELPVAFSSWVIARVVAHQLDAMARLQRAFLPVSANIACFAVAGSRGMNIRGACDVC